MIYSDEQGMTSSYRSRMEIVAQILHAANGRGETRIKIMYKAFLSYSQLKEYLEILVEKELLEYNNKSQIYRTTEKGHAYLKEYEKIGDYVNLKRGTYAYSR